MPADTNAQQTETMQCMEVWGGSQPIDSKIQMWGLDAWVYSKPFGGAAAGGDVYYVSSCATGRITRLLVADVSGHGAESQQPARALRDLMRRYVNYLDQTRFVEEMNRQFVSLSECGCFATALVTTFFATNGHLSLCNAGHPPPLIFRTAAKTWDFVESTPSQEAVYRDLPLGIFDQVGYGQGEFSLATGDMLLCYTDSLIEARRQDSELLGANGLLRIVRQIDSTDPTRIVPLLLDAIAAECPDGCAADDMTVLVFRAMEMAGRFPATSAGWRRFELSGESLMRSKPGARSRGPICRWPTSVAQTFTALGNRWRGAKQKPRRT